MECKLVVLRSQDVDSLLAGSETTVIELVREVYISHDSGNTVAPNVPYLRFPHDASARIIAKPAFIRSAESKLAGVKWVSSFPNNTRFGIPRASAILLLNSAEDGRVTTVIEASAINAWRTAASAALASVVLHVDGPVCRLGLVGCGHINFQIARFLLLVHPGISVIDLYDVDHERARGFGQTLLRMYPGLRIDVTYSLQDLLPKCDLVSFATNATKPHISDIRNAKPSAVLLHVSLRDLTVDCILMADNVVDDREHVCSNETSIHLAFQQCGRHDVVRTTLGAILSGRSAPRFAEKTVVFSPFGLGIFDVALGGLLSRWAEEKGRGIQSADFLPSADRP